MANWPIYNKGEWDAVCDDCGRKFKSPDLRLRWDGLMVCKQTCWEPRQPQDFVRAKVDIQSLPWTRPEAADTFVPISYTLPSYSTSDSLSLVEGITIIYTQGHLSYLVNGTQINALRIGYEAAVSLVTYTSLLNSSTINSYTLG